jgi:hypothetical protein
MKGIVFVFLGFLLTISVHSQHDSFAKFRNNYIYYNEFYILRIDSSLKYNSNIDVDGIKNMLIAEQLFGNNNTVKHLKSVSTNEEFTIILYSDGLMLSIPDLPSGLIEFWITSIKYKLVLKNGKEFKKGMDWETLKDTFPRSYSNRRILSSSGNTLIEVALVKQNWDLSAEEGVWIVFDIDKNKNTIESISTRVPD